VAGRGAVAGVTVEEDLEFGKDYISACSSGQQAKPTRDDA